ncbi:MAG TPA: hypothetical protein VK508_02610 [Cyclobacteriaceae bacterium]|nr:hypothetical protein [Cyclobacteriaceae bacterium]
MTPFEYITVLISIILGLGITQIVTGVADIIHQWNRVRIYWPHLLWIVLVFFLHIQEWWWLYELRTYEKWRLPIFLFVILYPINLFILARILFPYGSDIVGTGNQTGKVDLKEFYFGNYRKFFLLIAVLAVLAVLDDVFIQHYRIIDEAPQLAILTLSTLITTMKLGQEWIHRLFVVALVLMMLITFAVQWNEWLVGA